MCWLQARSCINGTWRLFSGLQVYITFKLDCLAASNVTLAYLPGGNGHTSAVLGCMLQPRAEVLDP